jgi:RNA polymerase sigma-70 factor (ECF subfamily)
MPGSISQRAPDSNVITLADRRDDDGARWLVAFAAGDRDAFEPFVRRWANVVYAAITRSGLDGADRDDLFQEVWIKVARAAGRFEPNRPVAPWLLSIVLNAVRDARRSRATVEKARTDTLTIERADAAPAPGDHIEAAETADWLASAVAALPDGQREAVLLCAVQGCAQADAAEVLGVPVNTVKTLLRRGRMALAQALARRRSVAAREGGR